MNVFTFSISVRAKSRMGDFTQPQQKYAGTGENCNFAIAVIFYPGIKTL